MTDSSSSSGTSYAVVRILFGDGESPDYAHDPMVGVLVGVSGSDGADGNYPVPRSGQLPPIPLKSGATASITYEGLDPNFMPELPGDPVGPATISGGAITFEKMVGQKIGEVSEGRWSLIWTARYWEADTRIHDRVIGDTPEGKQILEYMVEENDTLESISSTFSVSASDIKRNNSMKSNKVYSSTLLYIYGKAPHPYMQPPQSMNSQDNEASISDDEQPQKDGGTISPQDLGGQDNNGPSANSPENASPSTPVPPTSGGTLLSQNPSQQDTRDSRAGSLTRPPPQAPTPTPARPTSGGAKPPVPFSKPDVRPTRTNNGNGHPLAACTGSPNCELITQQNLQNILKYGRQEMSRIAASYGVHMSSKPPSVPEGTAECLNSAFYANKVTNIYAIAFFLATCAEESSFAPVAEGVKHYTVSQVLTIWGKSFYREGPYANHHVPKLPGGKEQAEKLVRLGQPALLNHVYAWTNGNQDEKSGDGWRFRGRGLIQLTGRGLYRDAGYENNPEALEQTVNASADASVKYWSHNFKKVKVNNIVDAKEFISLTRLANGAETNLIIRWIYYKATVKELFGKDLGDILIGKVPSWLTGKRK